MVLDCRCQLRPHGGEAQVAATSWSGLVLLIGLPASVAHLLLRMPTAP